MVSVLLHNSVNLIIFWALSGLFYCSFLVPAQFPFWGVVVPGSFHAIPTSKRRKAAACCFNHASLSAMLFAPWYNPSASDRVLHWGCTHLPARLPSYTITQSTVRLFNRKQVWQRQAFFLLLSLSLFPSLPLSLFIFFFFQPHSQTALIEMKLDRSTQV